MTRRLLQEISVLRMDPLRLVATYATAALFAYVSRVFWPLSFTPQVFVGAVSNARGRFVQFWRNRLS